MLLHLVDPLGFRQDGRPIWAFTGSAPDDGGDGGGGTGGGDGGGNAGDGSGDGDGDGDDPDAIGDDGLNARGRSAIKAERTKVRNLTGEVRGWRLLARDFGEGGTPATPDRVRELLTAAARGDGNGGPGGGSGGGDQVDVERIRRDAERDADAKAQRRIALAEVRALAAQKFADPADAVAFLQGDVDDLLDRQGEPDASLIESALDDLLQKKPHLAKREEGPPNYDGGPRSTGAPDQTMSDWIRGTKRRQRR